MSVRMDPSAIETFWQQNPCGEMNAGGFAQHGGDYKAFFDTYDAFRYTTEPHIPACLDAIDFKGKHTLEVGLGLGADAEQIIRRGALWSGIDPTAKSIERVAARMAVRQLPICELRQGSVLDLPFGDRSIDLIYSHGVLHHVPDIDRAQRELWRVLKPDGELIVMLYARWSLNYLLSISVLRRLGLAGLYLAGQRGSGLYKEHLDNARRLGLWRYLSAREWIHRNTDGPGNPYSKVYDLRTVRRDFPNFTVLRAYKRLMHAPPLPVRALPFERWLGWHLWVHLKPRPMPQ